MRLPRERRELVPGYLLHQRPYRESSALLEVFTADDGRVGLVARGARGSRSRLRGELQPFRALRLSWRAGGELGTLSAVEADGPAAALRGTALYSAFYLNELLIRLLARHDPHPTIYAGYAGSLDALARGGGVETVLRLFELALLRETGYGLQLEYDSDTGEALEPQADYDYHLEDGPVRVAADEGAGFVFRGASLLAMARGDFSSPGVLKDAKRLMRAALRLYLGDKPLKSRELFRSLRK